MMRANRQSGFSLLELIVVIVLLGIVTIGAGLLVVNPTEAFDAQQRRQQLVDQGEMALRQIATDVRRALPNSLRLSSAGSLVGVEFVNTVDGARYRDAIDDSVPASGANEILDFTAADSDFNLLGSFNSLGAFSGGQRLVIYNTTPATLYQDASANNNPGIITPGGSALTLSVSAQYPSEQHVNIGGGGFQFAQQSPGQRLFVVDGPVSYVCDTGSGELLRYSGYGYNLGQSLTPGGTTTTVATQLQGCTMTYNAGTAQRGGILTLGLTIAIAGESVNLLHQIQVENVP